MMLKRNCHQYTEVSQVLQGGNCVGEVGASGLLMPLCKYGCGPPEEVGIRVAGLTVGQRSKENWGDSRRVT